MPSLRSGALDRRLCSFSFWQRRLWHTCQLLSQCTKATLFFSTGPVCSSFSAEACTILHAFCWSWQHQQVCHFSSAICLLLCPRLSVISSILPFTLISGRNCLLSPPVLSSYNGSPDTCFSSATTRLMSWPDGERYLFPRQSLAVSLLLSLISTFLFSELEAYCLI